MAAGDREAIREFSRAVHGDEAVPIIEEIVFDNPFNPPDAFALLEDQGEILSFSGLLSRRLRLGGQEVPAGEIAVVGTHPSHRGRGLATRLQNHWQERMKDQEIPLAFLFGIPGFYQQFHFAYAVPSHSFDYTLIAASLLKDLSTDQTIENLTPGHLDSVRRIYQENNWDNNLTQVRSRDYWYYRIETTDKPPHSWKVSMDGDNVTGYLWLSQREEGVIIREAGARDAQAARALGRHIYLLCEEDPSGKIGLRAPLDNPLARFFYHLGGRTACPNRIFPGTWAGMCRITDLGAILTALVPAMSQRLQESRFYGLRKSLALESEIGSVTLEMWGGQAAVSTDVSSPTIRLPYQVLTPMITGYRSLSSFKQAGVGLDHETFSLLETLFPQSHPYIWSLEESEETAR